MISFHSQVCMCSAIWIEELYVCVCALMLALIAIELKYFNLLLSSSSGLLKLWDFHHKRKNFKKQEDDFSGNYKCASFEKFPMSQQQHNA